MAVVRVSNTTVLKNKGFPVSLHVVERAPDGKWHRVKDDQGDESVMESYWLRFTNASLAGIEEPEPVGFGSMDAWEAASQSNPFRTMARTVAIMDDVFKQDGTPDVQYGGLRMEDGGLAEYMVATQSAVMIAQGVKPDVVRDFLAAALKTARETMDEQGDSLLERVSKFLKDGEEAAAAKADASNPDTPTSPSEVTPGTDSSDNGSQPVAALTSSGV